MCPSIKRQKLDEAGSDSFVATEELSQASCDESISDESYESDSSISDDDLVSFKTSQNRTDCINIQYINKNIGNDSELNNPVYLHFLKN